MPDKIPVFICYRQSDGSAVARIIYELLRTLPSGDGEGDAATLDIYFDRASPSVSDWKSVHELYLKRARAFILICTPGAKLVEGPDDWVHREIGWWLNNRSTAPILVDPLGEGSRYIPDAIHQRWPDAQRVLVRESDYRGKSGAALRTALEPARIQLMGGIIPSASNFYKEELEKEQRRASALDIALQRQKVLAKRLQYLLAASGLLLGISVGLASFAYKQMRTARDALAVTVEAEQRATDSSVRADMQELHRLLAQRQYPQVMAKAVQMRQDLATMDRPPSGFSDLVGQAIVAAVNVLAPANSCVGIDGRLSWFGLSPDGVGLLAITDRNKLHRWTTPGCAEPVLTERFDDYVAIVGWRPDGGGFAASAWDNSVRLWNDADAWRTALGTEFGRIVSFAFNQGELVLVTAMGHVFVLAAEPETTSLAVTPLALPAGFKGVFVSNGMLLLADAAGQLAYMVIGAEVATLLPEIEARQVTAVAITAAGQALFVGLFDGSIWGIATGDGKRGKVAELDDQVSGISAAPNGRAVAAYTDAQIAVLRGDEPSALSSVYALNEPSIEQTRLVGENQLFVVDQDGNLLIHGVDSRSELFRLTTYAYTDMYFDVSAAGNVLAFIKDDNVISVQPIFQDADAALAFYCQEGDIQRAAEPWRDACYN